MHGKEILDCNPHEMVIWTSPKLSLPTGWELLYEREDICAAETKYLSQGNSRYHIRLSRQKNWLSPSQEYSKTKEVWVGNQITEGIKRKVPWGTWSEVRGNGKWRSSLKQRSLVWLGERRRRNWGLTFLSGLTNPLWLSPALWCIPGPKVSPIQPLNSDALGSHVI